MRSRALLDQVQAKGPMAISRALDVMQAMSCGVAPLSLSQLSRLLGIPKSSLFAVLGELEYLDLIRRDDDGLYQQSGRSRRLGLQLVEPSSVASAVRRTLTGIGIELGMTTTFSRLDPGSRALIYGDRWDVPDPVRFAVSLGQPLDLHCRSAGKLLVAYQPRKKWAYWFGPEPYRTMTVGTLTTLGSLVRELETIAASDVAWSRGESFPGVSSCNVGVRGVNGKVLAALGVEAPTPRLLAQAEEGVVTALRLGARELTALMQARGIAEDTLARHI